MSTLISQWLMEDDAASTVVIDSAGSNPGTSARNTDAMHVGPICSNLSGALAFNGSSDYVTLGNNASLSPFCAGDASLCFWIAFAPVGTQNVIGFSINFPDVQPDSGWYVYIRRYDNVLRYAGFSDGDNEYGGCALTSSLPQHIAIVKSGTTVSVYINGGLSETTNGDTSSPPQSGLANGASGCISSPGPQWLNGDLADVRLYSGALAQSDIAAIIAADGNPLTPPTPTVPIDGQALTRCPLASIGA